MQRSPLWDGACVSSRGLYRAFSRGLPPLAANTVPPDAKPLSDGSSSVVVPRMATTLLYDLLLDPLSKAVQKSPRNSASRCVPILPQLKARSWRHAAASTAHQSRIHTRPARFTTSFSLRVRGWERFPVPTERSRPCLFCPSCNRRLRELDLAGGLHARADGPNLCTRWASTTPSTWLTHAVQVRVALARARPSPLQSFTLESPAFAVGGLPDRFRPPDNFSRPHQKHPSAAAPADPISKI